MYAVKLVKELSLLDTTSVLKNKDNYHYCLIYSLFDSVNGFCFLITIFQRICQLLVIEW